MTSSQTIQSSTSVPYGILSRTHDQHQRYYHRWFLYENFYRGGIEVLYPRRGTVTSYQVTDKRKADTYLHAHERESQEGFDRRRKLAYYINLCWPAVEDNVAGVFHEPIQRVIDFIPEDLLKNVDWRGSSIQRFTQSVCRWSAVYGHVGLAHDATRLDANVLTQADVRDYGVRPYSYLVAPQDILDWQVDPNGQLMWVAFMEQHHEKREPFSGNAGLPGTRFNQQQVSYRVRLFTRDGWELIHYSGKQDAAGERLDGGEWPEGVRGVVPFTFSFFRRIDDYLEPFGESFLSSIADLNREILNLTSLVQDIHYQVTFPQLVIPMQGKLNDQERKELSIHRYTTSDPAGGTPVWLSPDPSTSDTLTRRIVELAASIKESAGLSTGGDVQAAQSGVALAWKHSTRLNLLAQMADNMQEAETSMWGMWARWMGRDPDEVRVDYPDDYATPASPDRFAEAEKLLSKIVGDSRKFKAEVKKLAAKQYLVGKVDKEVVEAVTAEIDEEATAPLPEEQPQPGAPANGADAMGADAEDEMMPAGQARQPTDVKAERDWMR